MSDKEITNNENSTESLNQKDELSSADKILKKIKEKKEETIDSSETSEQIIENNVVVTDALNLADDTNTEEDIDENEPSDDGIIDSTETSEQIIENNVVVTDALNLADDTNTVEDIDENEPSYDGIITEDSVEEDDDDLIDDEESKTYLDSIKNDSAFPEDDEDEVITEIDYTKYDIDELLKTFNDLLNNEDVIKYEKNIKNIKTLFYKQIEEEQEQKKNKFVEEGGLIEDYEPIKNISEATFSELYKRFLEKKDVIEKKLYEEKKKNLELKYAVIEEVRELINKPETFNKTFNKFKNLQKKWNDIGLVPKNDVRKLWDDYNKQIQKFYEYVEVNKELRELDFKKNFDIKIKLSESAEELLLETNYSKAKKELQELHKKWKETGSVSNKNREELWTRFQNATIKINENFSKHIDSLKDQQEKNLESKQFLVEKAKEYSIGEYENHLEWKEASDQVVQLQKLWKKIGYVPKEFNNLIYNQFKSACDTFFERIRAFYDETEKNRDDNYQRKLDLCNQAESLQESNEWNKTTDIYKHIQAEWKKIGPIPMKHSDEIWKRFRKACNNFFDRKKDFFKDKKSNEKENLILKEEIIKRIEEYNFSNNQIEDLKKLKEFQNEFSSVGYVPFSNKDDIYNNYHTAIDRQLSKLNISKEKQEELKFSENIEIIKNSPGSERLASKEIIKLKITIDKLKDDIKVWENNIGFFSSSKKSESMIKDIEDKIQNAKDNVALYESNIEELENIQD